MQFKCVIYFLVKRDSMWWTCWFFQPTYDNALEYSYAIRPQKERNLFSTLEYFHSKFASHLICIRSLTNFIGIAIQNISRTFFLLKNPSQSSVAATESENVRKKDPNQIHRKMPNIEVNDKIRWTNTNQQKKAQKD